MTELEYNNDTFKYILGIAIPLMVFGFIIALRNVFRHKNGDYPYEQRINMIGIYLNCMFIEVVIFGGIWAYRYAEAGKHKIKYTTFSLFTLQIKSIYKHQNSKFTTKFSI
jgi:hypothetical protein